MSQYEKKAGIPLDKRPPEFFRSISLAFQMNELLQRYGTDRDGGQRDISWNSFAQGAHYLLWRIEDDLTTPNDAESPEKYFMLFISSTESDIDGYQQETTITFSSDRGVVEIEGDVPEALQGIETKPEEWSSRTLDYIKLVLNSYE